MPLRSLAVLALAAALDAGAVDITVLSAGAVKAPFDGIAAAWEKSSGHHVRTTFAPAGVLREKLAAGAKPDLVIVPAEALDALAASGAIDPASRRDLGTVGIGVAVRDGAPLPDVSTPEALKRALLAAPSITYMDPQRGTSGQHVDEKVLPALGIRDAVRDKTVLGEGGYIAEKVARGEVALVIHQITEILPVSGVALAGPLPAPLQKLTVYSGAVGRSAAHAAEARALLEALAGTEGRKAFAARGFGAP